MGLWGVAPHHGVLVWCCVLCGLPVARTGFFGDHGVSVNVTVDDGTVSVSAGGAVTAAVAAAAFCEGKEGMEVAACERLVKEMLDQRLNQMYGTVSVPLSLPGGGHAAVATEPGMDPLTAAERYCGERAAARSEPAAAGISLVGEEECVAQLAAALWERTHALQYIRLLCATGRTPTARGTGGRCRRAGGRDACLRRA